MFKVGDIVWAKTHRYNETSYHRPCEVINIGNLINGRMIVKVLDTGKRYEIDSNEFETITEDKILYIGDILKYKEEELILLSYRDFGTALCKRYDQSEIKVKLKDVRKVSGFFV